MGICICCCCNKKNTECLENTLIVFNSIEIVFLLLGLILIEWKIVTNLNLVLNLIMFLLLIFSLVILVIFKILRGNETIYTKNRKLCYILALLGMSFSILCFVISILSESLISEKIYKYDHPCLYRLSNINNNNTNRLLTISNKTKIDNETLIKNICDNNITDIHDVDSIFWYNKRSAPKDIAMSYICSSIIEVLSLIGAFFWYNDIRRIKYCIKNRMNDERGLINYGPLGGYMGKNTEKNRNKIIGNEEVINMKDNNKLNMNVKMNIKKGNNNLSNNNSSIGFKEKNIKIKNDITNLQNDEIINEMSGESHGTNKIEEENEVKKQKEPSLYSEDFY